MTNQPTKPHVALSKDGDVLIIQGPGIPVLFISRAYVPALLKAPESATAILISDFGAAAIETMLAGNASFEATTVESSPGVIQSAILQFKLQNGLVVAYTTDDILASSRGALNALGIDFAVTDTAIEWDRKYAQLVGEVICHLPTIPPQIAGLHQFDPHCLANLVRDAIERRDNEAAQSPQTPEISPTSTLHTA
jgi:hypothetical protein